MLLVCVSDIVDVVEAAEESESLSSSSRVSASSIHSPLTTVHRDVGWYRRTRCSPASFWLFCLFFFQFLSVVLMEVAVADPYVTNPGPIDSSVLYDQEKHVSSAVWDGQERGALRCHEHTSKLDQWALTEKQMELVEKAGFHYLRLIPAISLDNPLISALVERALGNASLRSQSTISGCLTLLQCWSYFHLNVGRPKLNHDPMHDRFPFVLKWKGKQSGPTANRDVVFYRKALDSLKPCDVEWLPYRNMDSMVIPEDIKSTLILGRSKTMLICFDKAERHLPNRCLRQYGMLQSIPEDVQRWERKSRGVDGGVDLSGKMEAELNEWLDRRLHIVEGDDGADENEYMLWFLRITRKFVGRPISLSSEFQRTNAGLRDIAHIADTFSTKGLDPQQIDSISRIRFIAHECLRDQVGGPVIVSERPEAELGKRVRGKERVRRKGSGKRFRKDDQVQYNEASDDDQSQICGAAIGVDQLQLHHADRDVEHSQICSVDTEANHLQLIHAADEGENVQLCNANVEVEHSEPSHAAGKEENAEVSHVAGKEENAEVSNSVGKEKNAEVIHSVNKEEKEELSPTDMVDDKQLPQEPKEVDGLQLSDEMKGVNDSQISDSTREVLDSSLCDAATEVTESQLSVATSEVNDSRLSHDTCESDLHTTKEAYDVVPPSSLETREDIAQKGDCSVVV
nr:protein main-like 2 [Quercus suber]